ncbi:MAG: EamA family transporter, partial [Gammaproteobacteria bacterium]|nr:EamA family transporter [Gammaproteobacteria bacterium]
MATNSIFLILISSLFHSFWNILTQTSNNSQCFSALKGIWIIVLAATYFLFNGFPINIGYELFVWALISGILHGFYILSLSRAYSTEDISYVYPIARSAPVFVPLFAWLFLGEKISLLIILAVLVIISAIYILHFDKKLIQGLKSMYIAIGHNDMRWTFITLALVVSYSLVDKKAMDKYMFYFPDQPFTNGVTFFFLEAIIGFVICNIYIFNKFPLEEIIKNWSLDWRKCFLAGVATTFSYGLICVVLQFEKLSAVVSLRQISVLMVVYWGC